jgi:murein DD-endopeptidase MepM/ murein hydrolase activator NlpD
MSESWIEHHVFAPFPLAGPAEWIDSWHFVRYGPAPGEVRPHLGQDIFCNGGEPVLATVTGRVSFSRDGLGGRVAHLTLADGSFYYFAHLAGWNKKLDDGAKVHAGDVIGYCGNSGDAAGGPTHLHFGYYTKAGTARNPLHDLVRWLHKANRSVDEAVHGAGAKRISSAEVRTMARRFGLNFTPSLESVHAPHYLSSLRLRRLDAATKDLGSRAAMQPDEGETPVAGSGPAHIPTP